MLQGNKDDVAGAVMVRMGSARGHGASCAFSFLGGEDGGYEDGKFFVEV